MIQRYEVNLVQPLTLLTPLGTIILGVLVTHDRFDARLAIGAFVALIGVLIIALRRAHVMLPLMLIRSRTS